ncbi:MAG: DUF4249 domain-containing protein [Flavobacteriaceae bacterium]|nr:DUF4249 domain-containing protein [Flavobacteriaceae bacterium]
MRAIYILLIFGFLCSCEEVIDVDLNTSDPRLVIEANINLLEDGTSNSTVKLTTTAPFFDNIIPFVSDAIVSITSNTGELFNFEYVDNGIYQSNLVPEFDTNYTLEIIYNEEVYTSTQQLFTTVPIDFVEQRNDGGFEGDEIEIKVFFTDPEGEDNYYFFEAISDESTVLDTYEDDFFDGNQIFGLYSEEDLAANDEIDFYLYGVDRQFYNFMLILLQQGSDDTGGPFETQPATVRGNIINSTNSDHYPLGYFRISQTYSFNYTVQ